MRIRNFLTLSALALAIGAGFGVTGAMAQSDCQARISAIQARIPTSTGSIHVETYGTRSNMLPEALRNSSQPGDFRSTVRVPAGTMNQQKARSDLGVAQSLCAQGKHAEANEILARLESMLPTGGLSTTPTTSDASQ